MNQKGFASIILALVIIVFVGAAGYFILTRKQELATQQIILKIPILDHEVPEDSFSELVIRGYTDKIVKKGEEFVIEASFMNRNFTDVKLELVEIKNDSVVVNVLADALNKKFPSREPFVPRDSIEREAISNGSCIGALGPMDVVAKICFDFGKENGQIFLKYHLETGNTYPTP